MKDKEIIERLKKEVKGITLMVLVVTIIVLLILAGVGLRLALGENGIIGGTIDAKEEAEIAEEKETVHLAAFGSKVKNNNLILVEDEFQKSLDGYTGAGKTVVTDIGEEFEVVFNETNRYYVVDKNGNLKEAGEIVKDKYPGDITVGKDGESLDGSEEHPYEIWCIEDLVALSNMTRGTGIIFKNNEIIALNSENKNNFNKKYIKLMKNLNFKSKLSYASATRTDFGDINGNEEDGNTLINEMTTEKGFMPLEALSGTLDGNQKKLSNLYMRKEENAALIEKLEWGTVKNLEITGSIICLGDNAGAISAYHGNINNCINRVNIESEGNNVGGFIGGEYASEIQNCKNYANIKGNNGVGGICATWGKITNCQNYGNINGLGDIGGINGRYAKVTNCQNYGKIGNRESSVVGGIIAKTSDPIINYCKNYGKIEGSVSVGGIAGSSGNATIINCTNFGEIEVKSIGAGGICGYGSDFYSIINCCNLGKVKGIERSGGIIGELEYIQSDFGFTGKIINCYNAEKIEAEKYKGGIVGVKRGYGTQYIENCYWKKELNLICGENISTNGGILEITNSQEYTEQEMKSDMFLQILNNYVQEYNSGDKAYSKGEELLTWKLDEETGYPTFDI